MIQYESIKKAMGVDISVSPDMAQAIYRWQKMYRNKPPWISKDVKGLNLPAAISSEFARLVTNEAKIEISGSPRADMINQIIQKPLPGGCCHVFMILDMDNFKQLNDTLGHMSGDRALADFVAAADQALYKVKTSAKGCYCIAEQKK